MVYSHPGMGLQQYSGSRVNGWWMIRTRGKHVPKFDMLCCSSSRSNLSHKPSAPHITTARGGRKGCAFY